MFNLAVPSYNFQNVLCPILEILIWKSLKVCQIQLGGSLYASHFWELPMLISQFSYITAGATARLRRLGSERVNTWGLSGVSKSGSD